jgi:glycosyltransferase involved in cell wall biosynthesis
MKPIRLLAIIEASTITGPAKNVLQFARLARSGELAPPVEVSVAVFQRAGQPDLFLQTARQSSLPVYPIPEKGRFDRAVVDALFALGKQLQPDLLQSHAVKSHFLVRKSGLNTLAPWIAFHHGYTWPDLRARLYNQLDRWSLRTAAQVLTVSRPFQEELIRQGVRDNRIEIIHNAIDPQWGRSAREPQTAAALRARLGIDPARKVILIVGRLSREKDHISLLRAVSQLRELNPYLLIVGEGPERAPIEVAVRELQLDGAVNLTGQVPSAEPYYGIADIAVLSSLSEGSPNALLEAMAAGVPVVATAVGGVPEIATHRDSALLIQPRDPQALSDSIRELLTSRALAEALTQKAYEAVLTRHTPESRVRRLTSIYAGLLAGAARQP